MPLFNEKIIATALHSNEGAIPHDVSQAAAEWAARASHESFDLQNESQLEQEFNDAILKRVLGYAPPMSGAAGTMQVKQPIPGGTTVDVALGHFHDGRAEVTAPLELKGPKVPLDRIMPGRAKTPIQQAWDYAIDAPGARWVVVSNMKELRLYAFGHGRQLYEPFDLRKIDKPDELRKLRLLLGAKQLLGGATKELLDRSESADREVTNQLYRDYKELRGHLMAFVRDQHPAIDIETRIRVVQTLLDRVLFIAFAEDRGLLPRRSLADAIEIQDKFFPRPKWDQLRVLFDWVDKGAPPHNIPPYNGGLFATNTLIDGLGLPDRVVEQFRTIADYDFSGDNAATILGHIFEQSITDIENEKAEARLAAPPSSASKKKREGVVYTPEFITRFIVEQTIGQRLREIEDELLPLFGKRGEDDEIRWRNKTSAEANFWTAYLDRMTRLRVLDPACGSGAFLIAAFNFLNAEQKRVRLRLSELRPGILEYLAPNADVEIITNNLFGVDVNAESVEITKLALWLQTAKRDRALESLDGNIRHGNSVVKAGGFDTPPFDWQAKFPDILADGDGFDIVIGNPPYVRMELLKGIKPHLEQRFAVAADRADLYAYFYELGVSLLAPGGRLGFISSSTFFRTGSGEPLRRYLSTNTQVESVIDFGDLQVFEGVTTYPAIVLVRKANAGEGEVRYLNARALPDDLSRTFREQSLPMPRARLAAGTWRFESDLLDTLRARMEVGRATLAETYGPPLYGIKTGLNAAFILTGEQRDTLIAHDPRSAELLKPFLVGENLKRWHVESDNLWLIYTPKNTVDIDDYPAIRDHLLPWKERLERRATKQHWWELQQAQANYEPSFLTNKVIYPHFNKGPNFSFDTAKYYSNDKSYIIPVSSPALAGFLNSKVAWFQLRGLAPAVRGGFREARVQYVGALRVPAKQVLEQALAKLSSKANAAGEDSEKLLRSTLHRLSDLDRRVGTTDALRAWPKFTFTELQRELAKRFKTSIPVTERDEWERWFDDRKARAAALSAEIAAAESEIDQIVYRLFDLTASEIAAIEDSLALDSPGLSLKAAEAISEVEGLSLSEKGRARVTAEGSTSDRRAAVSRAHVT